MSTYVDVAVEMTDLADLQAALDRCGLKYTLYPEGDGVYRKWTSRDRKNMTGTIRGRDAALVIHGGLDTTANRFCGDTAFVRNAGGTLTAKIDTAHGNSARNWTNIQNEYALVGLEKLARQHGLRLEKVEAAGGRITLRAYPGAAPKRTGLTRRTIKVGRG